MIATDINPNSLTLSRGLDALLRERNPQIEEAEIILNDFFSGNPLLRLKKECQTIALPFRLTSIAQPEQVVSAAARIIHQSDICCLHFLANEKETIDTLRGYTFKQIGIKDIGEGIKSNVLQTNKGHSICIWDPSQVETLISSQNGNLLDMQKVSTVDDAGNSIQMLVTIVEKRFVEEDEKKSNLGGEK